MAGYVGLDSAHATVLHGTGATTCKGGIMGTAGTARDTLLLGVYIALGAGPVTLTITGLTDEGNAARSMVLSGQVTIDTYVAFNVPILNEAAAFTFTASVADKVTVLTRAFSGP